MKTILIVDDEPHIRFLYETELRHAGYSTMAAKNAEKCLECVATMNPDLVILDIRMPDMDGIEVLQRLRVHHRRTPIIINTAYSSYCSNYMIWAADACVRKSSDLTELIETVNKLLPGRRVADRPHNKSLRKKTSNDERRSHV